jgi:hypothetical protein
MGKVKTFIPFEKAKEVVASLNLYYIKDWENLAKTPKRGELKLPYDPRSAYKDHWVSWNDFLGKKSRRSPRFVSYSEAVKIVRSLNIYTAPQWNRFSTTEERRRLKLPSSPRKAYKDEWVSWSEFVGKDLSKPPRFVPYSEAVKIVRGLNITTNKQWEQWSKTEDRRKLRLPSEPSSAYRNDWVSWPDFVGKSNNVIPKHVSYEEAKKIIKDIVIPNLSAWAKFIKTKDRVIHGLPSNPERLYAKDWKGWNNFLSSDKVTTHRRSKSFVSYEEAKIVIQEKGIINNEHFRLLMKSPDRPDGVPTNPDKHYPEWISWKDFLDTRGKLRSNGRGLRENRLPMDMHTEFAINHNIVNRQEWIRYSVEGKLPDGFSKTPKLIFSDTWTSWKDFLGLEKQYVSYSEAQVLIQPYNLTGYKKFFKFMKSPTGLKNIPSAPQRFYKEWVSWDDFLVGGPFFSFDEAKRLMMQIGIKNKFDYAFLAKTPARFSLKLPARPDRRYGAEWLGWRNFFGLPEKMANLKLCVEVRRNRTANQRTFLLFSIDFFE